MNPMFFDLLNDESDAQQWQKANDLMLEENKYLGNSYRRNELNSQANELWFDLLTRREERICEQYATYDNKQIADEIRKQVLAIKKDIEVILEDPELTKEEAVRRFKANYFGLNILIDRGLTALGSRPYTPKKRDPGKKSNQK